MDKPPGTLEGADGPPVEQYPAPSRMFLDCLEAVSSWTPHCGPLEEGYSHSHWDERRCKLLFRSKCITCMNARGEIVGAISRGCPAAHLVLRAKVHAGQMEWWVASEWLLVGDANDKDWLEEVGWVIRH